MTQLTAEQIAEYTRAIAAAPPLQPLPVPPAAAQIAPAPAAIPGPASTRLDLLVPLTAVDGTPITSVTLTELRQAQKVAIESKHATDALRGAAVIAAMTGLALEQAMRLKVRDANRIGAWRKELNDPYRTPETDPLTDGGRRTFPLLVPLKEGARLVTEITLTEPDVATGIAAGKFKTEAESDAGVIATLAGLTIPVVMQLVERDLVRLKAWLGPFVGATELTETDGETSR